MYIKTINLECFVGWVAPMPNEPTIHLNREKGDLTLRIAGLLAILSKSPTPQGEKKNDQRVSNNGKANTI